MIELKDKKLQISDIEGLKEVIEKIKESNENFANAHNLPWLTIPCRLKNLSRLPPIWNNCVKTTFLLDRVTESILNSNQNFKNYIRSGKQNMISCLDLGSGMCQIAPILKHLGFKEYVGLDLYHDRIQYSESKYIQLSIDCANKMMSDLNFKNYRIVKGNVVNARLAIERESELGGYNLEQNFKFDLIITSGTNYAKRGEGISDDLLNQIKGSLLAENGIIFRYEYDRDCTNL